MTDQTQYPLFYDVPSRPTTGLWDDLLRWCIFVMNREDPQRHFAASCLAWVLKSGGLTEKQATACEKMLRRVTALYEAGALDCQVETDPCDTQEIPTRRDMH